MTGRKALAGGASHMSRGLMEQYAAGGTAISPDVLWAAESHLESCAACRADLGDAIGRCRPDLVPLLGRVRAVLSAEVAASAQMPARRRRLLRVGMRWAPPTMVPWLLMTILVIAAAAGLDVIVRSLWPTKDPILVSLLAPISPLVGVAAAWTRGTDPAHEMVAGTPRAGLDLLLRRTLVVLSVAIPALLVAGWVVGTSPARWLLPSLAFTVGALTLGAVIGLRPASITLGLLWSVIVVAPTLLLVRVPVVLEPVSMPWWAALITVVTVVLVLRREAYTRLPSGQ